VQYNKAFPPERIHGAAFVIFLSLVLQSEIVIKWYAIIQILKNY